jgi:hypothetical protein
MAWLKVDDKVHDHKKVLKLLRTGAGRVDVAPLGLWLIAATWAADNRTDGWVPDYLLDRWDDNAAELAARLVDVGLWTLEIVDGEDGYRFHDWADYQPTKAKLEADAEYNRRKAELLREPKLSAAIRDRDQDRCRYCGSAVSFTDRRSALGGTYDHIDPDGPNSLGNTCVACRGCNSAKGHSTPEQWGRRLLPPGSMGLKSVPSPDQTREGARAGRAAAGSGTGNGMGPGRAGARTGSDPGLDADLPVPSTGEGHR